MGSSTSKAASTTIKAASKLSPAAKSAPRKYPTRSPQNQPSAESKRHADAGSARIEQNQGIGAESILHSSSRTLATSDAAGTETDISDPQLAARLRSLGPVVPNPTQSNSSTFNHPSSSEPFRPSASTPSQSIFPSPSSNPAVSLLTARYRLAEEAEREFENVGRAGAKGRTFLDVVTLRQVLILRGKGMRDGDIEEALELGKGVVARLGGLGVVGVAD